MAFAAGTVWPACGTEGHDGDDDDLPGQPVLLQGQTMAMTLTMWAACMITGTMSMTMTDLGSHRGW